MIPNSIQDMNPKDRCNMAKLFQKGGKGTAQHLWRKLNQSGCTALNCTLRLSNSLQGFSQGAEELSLVLPPNQPSCLVWRISSHHKGLLNHQPAIIPGKVSTSEYSQDTSHHPLGPSKHQAINKSFGEATFTRLPGDYFMYYIVI